MNEKRAKQIRKFLNLKKNRSNDKYDWILTKEDTLVGRKYKIKQADVEKGTAEAEREDTYGHKLQMLNTDKTEAMYKAIKKDYYSNKQEVLEGLQTKEK